MEYVGSKFDSPYANVPPILTCSAPRLGTDMDYCLRDLQPDFYTPRIQHEQSERKAESAKKCKRRLEFCGGGAMDELVPPNVARRNERERNRVRLINTTFSTLRQHLPGYSKTTKTKTTSTTAAASAASAAASDKNKKLSKVDTLKSAIEYITQLQELLDENDAVNAAFRGGLMRSGFPRIEEPLSPGSVTSHEESESASETDRDTVDGDLLHFTNWF